MVPVFTWYLSGGSGTESIWALALLANRKRFLKCSKFLKPRPLRFISLTMRLRASIGPFESLLRWVPSAHILSITMKEHVFELMDIRIKPQTRSVERRVRVVQLRLIHQNDPLVMLDQDVFSGRDELDLPVR